MEQEIILCEEQREGQVDVWIQDSVQEALGPWA